MFTSSDAEKDVLVAVEPTDDKTNKDVLLEGGEDDAEDPTTLHLRVKSFRDTNVTVRSTDSVSRVKQSVIQALGQEAKDRYLRLIVKGRLLAPDSRPLHEFSIQTGDVVHAVLAKVGQRGGAQALLAGDSHGLHQRGSTSLLRGAGVTSSGLAVRWNAQQSSPDDDSSVSDVEEGGRPREGFDRLRTTGLRRSEITAIRAYFSRHVDRWIRQNPEAAEQAAGDETDALRRRFLQEEAWMQTQGPTSEFRINLAGTAMAFRPAQFTANGMPRLTGQMGTDRDFLWGFLLGFFVGFLMLVWVWMPTVPHKQKLGILTGISFQLALSMFQGNNEDTDESLMGD